MNILIAEDDVTSAAVLREGLERNGHRVETVHDGVAALERCLGGPKVDAIVLDRMMPGLCGMEVVRRLRAHGVTIPVLFLTARSALPDRVDGLMAGADDYLVKPFQLDELEARLFALTRRAVTSAAPHRLSVHDLHLDLVERRAERQGKAIGLQDKEYQLLRELMQQAGRPVTRTMLLERIWGYHFDPQTTLVETHMSRLRTKVDKPFDAALIRTIRHGGYMIGAPD